MKIAIIGATGLVGSKFLEVLKEKQIQADYTLFSSSKSAGKVINFLGIDLVVQDLEKYSGEKFNYALFSAGGEVSKRFCPLFAKAGAVVIDNSSAWRMDKEVPLVVPEVNASESLLAKKGIIANPNCSTIQMVQVLTKIDKVNPIKRVVVSTYQSVSGAGVEAIEELKQNAHLTLHGQDPLNKKFSKGIAFNCIPQIDVLDLEDYTKEEMKMIKETSKIMGKEIPLSATCVRVPTLYCHAESVNIELTNPLVLEDIINSLKEDENLEILNNLKDGIFPTNTIATNSNKTYVGRIRKDLSVKSGINLWIVSDNLRKGAALNAVQILEFLISKNTI